MSLEPGLASVPRFSSSGASFSPPFTGWPQLPYGTGGFEGQSLSVAELMREMDRRGWEVGLHGTFHSFDTRRTQKAEGADRSITQKEFLGVRQLAFILIWPGRRGPRLKAGFKYDSTWVPTGSSAFGPE